MKDLLKIVGGTAFSIVMFAAAIVLAFLFITGGVWLSDKLLPWLVLASWLVTLLVVLLFLPLSLLRAARRFTSIAILISSYVLGLTLWMEGLLLTYVIWGGFAVFVGLFLAGIGVVPVAMLATLINGMWFRLAELVVLTFMTFGSRALAFKIAASTEVTPEPVRQASVATV